MMPSTWPIETFFVLDGQRFDKAAAGRRGQVDRDAVGQ